MVRTRRAGAVKSFLASAGFFISVLFLSASNSFAVYCNNPMTTNLSGANYSAGTAASPLSDVITKGPEADVRAYASFSAAITAIGATNKSLLIPNQQNVTANITVPANITLHFIKGGSLNISTGVTVTINGQVDAGLFKIFTCAGTGKVALGVGSIKEVYPQWWGSGTGSDDSPAINAAISSSPASTGINVRLIGNFTCTATINVNRHRVSLIGNGQYATQITFTPTSALPLFNFAYPGGGTTLEQCAIRDMALYGGGTYQKIGIKIVDADIIEVRNIAMLNWTGNSSIGLQIQGRDFGFIENINVVADLPISIEDNPYCGIDIDHTVFNNTYLITLDNNGPAVKIATGVNLTNVVFQGTNSWCCGKYGLQWIDTTSTQCSANLSIKNVRYEQPAAEGGEVIHISPTLNYPLHNLVLENIYAGGKIGGFYLRSCANATLQNLFYYSSDYAGNKPVALDIDESSSNLVLINCWWQTGEIINTGNLVKTFGTSSNPAHPDNRTIETYDAPGNPQGDGLTIYGTKTWCYSGTLANGTVYYLPVIGAGLGTKTATVLITASDSSTVNAAGHFMVGGGASNPTILVAGTTNVATTPTGGKLCLVPGNRTQLINYLGVDVDVVITVFWK